MIFEELRRTRVLILSLLFSVPFVYAQSIPEQMSPVLNSQLQAPEVVEFQLREYLMAHVAKLPPPTNSDQWTAEAQKIRKHLLDDVVYHGWPREWVNSPPKFEDLGTIESGEGYRMRKLRYEIVPGFYSAAILYEPTTLRGKVPAILNVNGHDYSKGKAVEWKQKRCINFAKRGIVALSLEWIECGELFDPTTRPVDHHWVNGYLDLVGTSAIGLFYLAMRRGLDYLYEDPNVDRNYIGMTGLSGGGWQTITLSSLDTRVRVAVPVAGYASLVSQIERISDSGDIEQSPADFYVGVDNAHLTAMMAPRPTLLIFDAQDDCCYRAPLVKPYVYDQVRPFFNLYGSADDFQWHENTDPGTHNYQLDNRLQAYRFFSEHFHLPVIDSEIPSDAEIKSYEELLVGLPKDNLTALGLARQFEQGIKREPIPSAATSRGAWEVAKREQLKDVVRCRETDVKHAWAVTNTKEKGVETRSYRFELSNGLSATGVWAKAVAAKNAGPVTIVLNDDGKRSAATVVSDRVNRGERVLAMDLLFTGDSAPDSKEPGYLRQYLVQAVASIGDRALGLEAAQLIAVTQWLRQSTEAPSIRLDCTGIRTQTVALIAAALQPSMYSEVEIHRGMRSLGYILAAPVSHWAAPDLFCLDLYKEFDLDHMITLAEPTRVIQQDNLE